VLEHLARHENHEETSTALLRALELAEAGHLPHHEAVARLGKGWIAEEALAIGLYAALTGSTFSEVVRIGANHDGDSDSTASIAGQLHGAAHGACDVPLAWMRRLDVYEPLLILAHDLDVVGSGGGELIEQYPPT